MQERRVKPEEVTATVQRAAAAGWELINTTVINADETLLIFQKKKRGWHRWVLGCMALSVLACIGLCVAAYLVAPTTEELNETRTVEAVAEASQKVIDDMTATVVALTPSSTPVPTRTPRPTETPAPMGYPEILGLIRAAMEVSDLPINGIEMQENNTILAVSADQMRRGYGDELEYRATFIGALTGAVVPAFDGQPVRPPQWVMVFFQEGSITIVKVSFRYADAKRFLDGNMTMSQFIDSWTIE